jgi:hypothetical protein
MWSRRAWLRRTGLGFGSLAAAALLHDEARADAVDPLARKQPHFAAKAQRVIMLFLEGGPSHLDTFDPKPKLSARTGQMVPATDEQPGGVLLGSPFEFKPHGQSGLPLSSVFPKLAECADDLCVLRSLHTDEPSHESALLLMNCGTPRAARPSLGSWLTYGLGTVNQNLPGYVVLYDRTHPLQGPHNWQAAFLPGVFQGTALDTQHKSAAQMIEHLLSQHASDAEQRLQLDLLQQINRQHAQMRRDDARLETRLQAFELVYRLQTEAHEAFDLAHESKRTRELYGATPMGRQCLLARRLVERGVRFVQVYHSGWDHHNDLATALPEQAARCDEAIAGLLIDLKQRGLLADTLVVCAGEFGRTPTADAGSRGEQAGRDHNHRGFSGWLAGGGVKGGLAYGATDELGHAAVENKVHIHDLHATILHLLGLDHEKLTYRYAGRDFRLTNVAGKVVSGILA